MNPIKQQLSKHILADGYDLVMDIEKSHGNYIVDKLTGETYLDMFTMFASTSIGYNHPHLVENEAFLGKMATFKPTLSDVYTQEYADFMEVFGRVMKPNYLEYAFFVEGGALAVENAMKVAFDWKTRKNKAQGSNTEADVVIHFKQAFHGRSGYTLSLTNTSDPRKYMYFPKFDWPRVENPKMTFPFDEQAEKQTISLEEKAKQEIEHAFQTYGNRVCSIIIETIQGEGGDNFFRKEFHEYLRNICTEKEALLIYDEVQCGMGITGKMWAHEHYGIIPDVMTFGKKAQVCGIMANKAKLDEVEQHVFVESSRINSTFGGNFIDFCRLKLILEVYEQENLLENIQKQGLYLLKKLEELQQDFPDAITNVRGVGLWCAFDLPTAEARSTFINTCYQNKLILLVCGDVSVRFRPHLTVTELIIDDCMNIVRKSL